MDSARPSNPPKFLTLQQAAQSLAVSIDVLISWNENNILKPTITPTGEIGYSQQQIDKFLEIRNASKLAATQTPVTNPSPILPNAINSNESEIKNAVNLNQQINNFNIYTPPLISSQKNKSAFPAIGIFSSFSFLFIVIFLIFLSQEKKLDSILNESSTLVSVNQNAKLTTLDEKNKMTQNSLTGVGDSLSQNIVNVFDKAFEDRKGTVSASTTKVNKDHLAAVQSIVGSGNEIDSKSEAASEYFSYAQKANLDESSEVSENKGKLDIESGIFDAEGNIKVSKDEEDENRLIATKLAMGGINQAQGQIKQNTSSVTFISFLILATFAFYMLYSRKRQLFPSLEHPVNLDIQPQKITHVVENPKLLEVFQKTDGTVAIFFQGKEYKISKPELDSESDKFIERLMLLVGPNVKEIEYDSLQDDNMIISTPLSKLVTRLGFVGIKRDLFFPRTSKTRVHFRKYITAEDLISMNLTPDQITFGFLENN